jgi:hypothetical protein
MMHAEPFVHRFTRTRSHLPSPHSQHHRPSQTTIMADSDSSLSSAPSEDEMPVVAPVKVTKPTPQKKKKSNGSILGYLKAQPSSPPRKKRPASPPHEIVPEDNPDIAVSDRRVNRVVSRRDRAHHAFYHHTVAPANILTTGHCHV